MRNQRARLDKLDQAGASGFVAIVAIPPGTPEAEAQRLIDAKHAEAQAVGYNGVIVIMDDWTAEAPAPK